MKLFLDISYNGCVVAGPFLMHLNRFTNLDYAKVFHEVFCCSMRINQKSTEMIYNKPNILQNLS